MLSCPLLREGNRKNPHLALWLVLHLPPCFPPHCTSPTLQDPKIWRDRGQVCDEGLQLRSLSTQKRKRSTHVVQRPQRWVHIAGSQIGQPLSLNSFLGFTLNQPPVPVGTCGYLLNEWRRCSTDGGSYYYSQNHMTSKGKDVGCPRHIYQWIGCVIGSWSLVLGPKMTQGPIFFDDVTSSFSHITLSMGT